MGSSSSRPSTPEPQPEPVAPDSHDIPDHDHDFNDTITEVHPPPDPRSDPDIIENESGIASLSVATVVSEYDEIKDAILKKNADTGKKYVYRDKDFPAEPKSLYYSSRAPSQWSHFEWLRPSDITRNPYLFTEGISSNDIVQGMLGDCWWLASVASISRTPSFMQKIIPSDQTMSGPEYVGAFHFTFWRYGKWVDIIVDDQLPTLRGGLAFARSNDRSEFWVSLLEKAYAKMHDSYQAIEAGFTQDGLVDLTGGIAMSYDLGPKTPPYLHKILSKAMRNKTFVCASIDGHENVINKVTGLVDAHAYSVLNYTKVSYGGSYVNLIKLRNPWGGDNEWKGPWSDKSSEWDNVSEAEKERLGFSATANGEWWMEYSDFVKYFMGITFCTVGPDFDSDGAPTGDRWLVSMIYGDWELHKTAGGSRNNLRSYQTNPQYVLELITPDDYDPSIDEPDQKGKCSVVVGLMQEYRRIGKSEGLDNLFICLNLYKVSRKPTAKLSYEYFARNREVINTGTYVNRREVTFTAELNPGFYVLVPSEFHEDATGNFLIRIFAEKNVDLYEL